jgi:primase-polymerase (primpol)-like protein
VGFEHTAGGGRTLLLGDDETLMRAAMTWKTGAKFARLWRGDTSDYRGDESAADQGLAALLVFATGHDAPRVERMMRASGLYRPKWERPGYLEQTIMRAMYSCGASYKPRSVEDLAAVEAAAAAVEGGRR